jgi:hypothetical protein
MRKLRIFEHISLDGVIVLNAAEFQLSIDHPLALRCKIGSRRGLLAASGRSDRSKQRSNQKLRNPAHGKKYSANECRES